ncbi:hypothetical protein LMG28614_06954 [Paraburkholderia ultramafica]|uniref:Uncharacterized protein n=1 Tax=Paraburkholderia ultramafica TaxID=1544867 RepID=A0A6S7C3J1_9BURK|nr:hypothetical protein [Paraburkholderia ultramafica]CAB3809109.1 hypothetical protein LMG28614_06954 [Paraburkholderia ultramafica]
MPTIVTDVYLSDMPSLFQRFVDIVEDRHWQRGLKPLLDESRRNSFLRNYYRREHSVAFQLADCSALAKRYGSLHGDMVHQNGLTEAVRFIVQVLSLVEGLPARVRDSFLGRVRNALRKPGEMRGLQLELTAATHFTRLGYSVRWPELEPAHPLIQGATFDLLIEDLGGTGLEVECKAASHDKGRSIHRTSALRFYEILRKELVSTSDALRTGLAVIVSVPMQFPASSDAQRDLAKHVRRQIVEGVSGVLPDGTSVRISEFDVTMMRDVDLNPESPAARAVIDAVTGTHNLGAMLLGRRNVGALAIVLQSAQDDSLMGAVFETANAAARDQLSGKRAGLILIGFQGVEADDLRTLAYQDADPSQPPTAARLAASRFLAGANRRHVVGIGFLSEGERTWLEDGGMTSGGVSYHFSNETSPLWVPEFAEIFRGGATR